MSERRKSFLLGLVVGFVLGYGISYLGILLFNWFLDRLGKSQVEISLLSGVPLGIWLALSMGVNMMNPPLAD